MFDLKYVKPTEISLKNHPELNYEVEVQLGKTNEGHGAIASGFSAEM